MPASKTNRPRLNPVLLASHYMTAKERVIDAGFAGEIDWQASISFDAWDERTFLRESAWVVLSAGFRESVLRGRFCDVSAAFLDWVNADSIIAHRKRCRSNALSAFRNPMKIDAILHIVKRVATESIEVIREQIRSRGIEFIRELPFMGAVSSLHLAKNLGLPVSKPDRHLNRFAEAAGYSSSKEMCELIAKTVGDTVSVVDVVIWRYATLTPNYEMALRAAYPHVRGRTLWSGPRRGVEHQPPVIMSVGAQNQPVIGR